MCDRELSVQETAKIFKNLKEALTRLKAVKPEQNSSELLLLGFYSVNIMVPKKSKWLVMLVRVCNPSTSRLRQEDAKCDVCLKYIVKSCYKQIQLMPLNANLRKINSEAWKMKIKLWFLGSAHKPITPLL